MDCTIAQPPARFKDDVKADAQPLARYDCNVRSNLTEILVCPLCKGQLSLVTFREEDGDIIEGRFDCEACNVSFPIDDGIPNMLPPDLRD